MASKIEDYALIGDLETAALVDKQRFDRLALLARFLLRRLFCLAARHRRERILEDCPGGRSNGQPRAVIAITL